MDLVSLKRRSDDLRDTSTRMGACQSCLSNPGKYRCPGCSFVSCSAKCVASHKRLAKCDGIRNKSKFISLNEFSERDLLNDYQFLESASRCTESTARDKLKTFTRKGENSMKLPKRLLKLCKACSLRRCKLLHLPPHFDRHRSNTSMVNFETFDIYWKVELFFVHAGQKVVLEMVDEKTPISDLLRPYLEETAHVEFEEHMRIDNKIDDPILLDPYQIYRSKGFSKVKVLLKAEGISEKPRRFYSLDVSKSLVWNLQNKVIVENPIIYIVFDEHADFFSNDSESGQEHIGFSTVKEDNHEKNFERRKYLKMQNPLPQKDSTFSEVSFESSENIISSNRNFIQHEKKLDCESSIPKQKSNLPDSTSKSDEFLSLVQYSDSEDESS